MNREIRELRSIVEKWEERENTRHLPWGEFGKAVGDYFKERYQAAITDINLKTE